jgi:predicted amidohydrolase YtcJ
MNSGYGTRLVVACGLLAVSCGASQAFAANDRDRCADARDLRLVNGNIVTMDAGNSVVSSVAIKNGRIAAVGHHGDDAGGPCTRVIDLHGRTAIPGLIDNHNHIVLLGIRPGHDTRLESAASIAEVQEAISRRAATVPPGEFITAIGGWNSVQFAEKRLPTLAELDAAAPNHPVYVQQSFTGPSATNSSGKAFFESRGVVVGATGQIAANAQTLVALNALRAIQTFEDQKRGTLDAVDYGAALGVTTHFDMGGFIIPGTPHTEGSFLFDGAASWNPYTAYDAFLALQREGRLPVRLRVFFLSMDTQPENPLLTNRVLNAFREFGGDMMKIAGLGEFITTWPLFGAVVEPQNYAAAVHLAAERGWIYQQHTLSLAEDQFTTFAWERLNSEIPIADLHWSIAHALTIDAPTVDRLKTMGAGLALHGFRYLAGTPTSNGPPYRMIVDSGIHVGAGSDSAQISALNPWLMIYYMVTGKNSSGVLINAGQTVTRMEALRLYTAANGWFTKEEDLLGSIEVGKYGDVVVLDDNFLDPRRVSDEGIKRMRSVLTIVGGKVVHDDLHRGGPRR